MKKKRIYSGTKWENQVAYCRAIRVKDMVFVSGTTAINEKNEVVGKDNMYEQTAFILEKISKSLKELNASMSDIVRTRMYVTDITLFDEMARAHKAVFEGIEPAASCIEVKGFVNPLLLIEIEVDAVISLDA